MKKKKKRGFEPEISRLGICSLNNYATQHLTLNACNCLHEGKETKGVPWWFAVDVTEKAVAKAVPV